MAGTRLGEVTGTATNQYIGATIESGEFWFGFIGEIRIYNLALTPLVVRNNYVTTKWRYR